MVKSVQTQTNTRGKLHTHIPNRRLSFNKKNDDEKDERQINVYIKINQDLTLLCN